ncbi:RNA polymerase III transcription factor IIIC subunit-domain-containing protein [Clohesyomyces aquaticus]|uniref:RNA polymerase III transcription factor IIIC subunit-domain-containing protein n=1 Tax=Clohesyomyces aquaticus TaxID=1231657 RepID=A0A1Y1YZD9_9PLEO|nr:RNA polymerase III transcription factor IIIC subunit-domain-containing protein [Clohesyomyces aquaticus]
METPFEEPDYLSIRNQAISCVEHPCIIRNVDKGLKSLGGPTKLSQTLSSEPAHEGGKKTRKRPKALSLSLRPDDPFAKHLLSQSVVTGNVLLKVTVPRRTGRKRKRGTTGPFLTEQEIESNANASSATSSSGAPLPPNPNPDPKLVFRTLQDNPSSYTVTPVGLIPESHRFRHLPDLQFAASPSPLMQSIKTNFLPLQYTKIKNYTMNTAPLVDLSRPIEAPPEFLQLPTPFPYMYQQNAYVRFTSDGREVNTQRRLAPDGYHIIKPTAATVPMAPRSHLPLEENLTPYIQSLVARIRAVLAQRPIATRHFLYNTLGWAKRDRIREAAVYCGYFFETGPWREALIAFGLDPRTDPKWRWYQTISFLSYQKGGTGAPARTMKTWDHWVRNLKNVSKKELERQHIFDGKSVSTTGNTFQFCDITDPLLVSILSTEDIRETCAPTFHGWYHVGTWAKATVILKDKINTLNSPPNLPPPDTLYARVASWPENFSDEEVYATYRAELHDRQIHREKFREHRVMHCVRWAARNPRYAFERMSRITREDRQREEEDNEGSDRDAEGEVVDDGDVEGVVQEDATEVPDRGDVSEVEDDEEGVDDDDEEEEDEDEDDDDDESDDGIGDGDDPDGENRVGSEYSSDDEFGEPVSGRRRPGVDLMDFE